MRVTFLDIDGVLNSEAFALKLEEKHRQLGHTDLATCGCFQLYSHIDPEAIARVNRLVAETGAVIVISSTWRKRFDLSELQDKLREHGLVADVVGVTTDGHKDPEMVAVHGHLERIYRGHEIDLWLRNHPEVTAFVIFDDDSDMAMHGNRLVQTDCQEGLLDDHVDLAIRVLAWDGTTRPSPFDDLEGR